MLTQQVVDAIGNIDVALRGGTVAEYLTGHSVSLNDHGKQLEAINRTLVDLAARISGGQAARTHWKDKAAGMATPDVWGDHGCKVSFR
eukprot:6392653-Karenia_brevis.AAC.1